MDATRKKQWHAPSVLSVAAMSDAEAKPFNIIEANIVVLGLGLVNAGPAS